MRHIRAARCVTLLKKKWDEATDDIEYEQKMKDSWKSIHLPSNITKVTTSDSVATTEVPFTKDSGVCNVKCSINGLPLYFIFDTGASTVSISMVEATFMMKNGYISSKDVIGSNYFMDANGNVSEGTTIKLREVNFGGLKLNNVNASVVSNQRAPLLLGQSVLSRLGKIEIDNEKRVLRIRK